MHPNDVIVLILIWKRLRSHFCSILTMTMLRSQNARALRMKLVDDLWNTGFWSGCVPFRFETAKKSVLNVAPKRTDAAYLFVVGWH